MLFCIILVIIQYLYFIRISLVFHPVSKEMGYHIKEFTYSNILLLHVSPTSVRLFSEIQVILSQTHPPSQPLTQSTDCKYSNPHLQRLLLLLPRVPT